MTTRISENSPPYSGHERLVIYFHGTPGAPEEARIFDTHAKEHGLKFVGLDRFALEPHVTGDEYYRLLARKISEISAGRRVDFVGFSMGAFVALQTSRHMPGDVASLHLVSAAAPLEAGDFVEQMAGKQVFKMASRFPRLFTGLTHWQGLLTLLVPNAMFGLLFANAAGGDKALAADPVFRASITRILKSCAQSRQRGYMRDVRAYVQPWKATLQDISIPAYIWHGDKDNWTPPAMAEYLQSALPGHRSTRMYQGLSHYSCLYQAAPEICAQLGTARAAASS